MHNPQINNSPTINVPLTLEQVAVALRKLSKRELETLKFLLDDKAMKIIKDGIYNPAYVRKIQRRRKASALHHFTTPQAFLKHLHGERK